MTHRTAAREAVFLAAYYGVTALFVGIALPFLLTPDRRPVRKLIVANARVVRFLMRWVGGIRLRVEGREHVPDGPYILAAKHGSWGDGYTWLPELPALTPVAGRHVLRPDVVRVLMAHAGAVVVDKEASPAARGRAFAAAVEQARERGEPLLIFPEGRIAWPGEHVAFERGVARLYEALGWPVVPAATSLERCWPNDEKLVMRPGKATARLLPPIPPGLPRDVFMARLRAAITGGTDELMGRGAEKTSEDEALAAPSPAATLAS